MLKATNITKRTPDGERLILDNVSASVAPGGLTAVIGPSGGGKTTLIKCLSLLEPPEQGDIVIDGDGYRFPLSSGQKLDPWPAVTVVFQQLFLWPHLTLRQNITLPIEHQDNVKERLQELIDVFDMEEFIDRYPNETSGGQKQRVALARALILNPKYVLLDEITSALDVEQAARVLNTLSKLRDRNIGVLLVTHSLGFARRAAEQVIFIADGQILESGDVSILDNPHHHRLKSFLDAANVAR
ncbi:MAG: amino acid ABC transporter ATP-binding protein [Gammaproteobacteria bacterium]|nr:amino acid ABC transporter ATP-binding protein [Gammaproteobacteria bacterium]